MNRYTILGQLGDGSFGTVSKAQHAETGEIVAVKRMKQRFHDWDECLQLREIQSLRKLQHRNLVKLKEVVRENTELFLIFEFCDSNIFQLQRQRSEAVGGIKSFNDREIRSIICQTLLAVQCVHSGGFMHRDLKPENLLIKGDTVKVADFGLAKEIRSRPPFTDYVSTRWYRAPENVLHSSNYNSPIDIWACGVILAELFLCRPLFPGTSERDQLFKICSILGAPSASEWDEGHQLARRMKIRFPTVTPTPIRKLLSHAPASAIDLIEKMLRFNPSERPSAAECLQHPFFTGGASTSSALYAGIVTGEPHNPFKQAAAGVEASPNALSQGAGVGLSGGDGSMPTASVMASSMTKYANLFNQSARKASLGTQSSLPTCSGSDAPPISSSQLASSAQPQLKDGTSDNVDDFNF